MSLLSDRADLCAALGHVDLARQILERMNYEELGMAESYLGDALFELHSWKNDKFGKFTKRGAYAGP